MFDDQDDLDAWPAFVDVMTSAVMFLLLGFVALAIGQVFALRDRVRQDAALAAEQVEPRKEALNDFLVAFEGAACTRQKWEIVCTFKDKLTFDTGRFVLRSEEARTMLTGLGRQLGELVTQGQVERIVVEGHTDPRPTGSEVMTNWELSSARAGHIVRYLEEHAGIGGEHLEAVGYAHHNPQGRITHEEQRFVAIRIRLKGSLL